MSGLPLRILLISTQFPVPPRSGFTTRVYHLALQLASRHDVTLLSYRDPDDAVEAQGAGEMMRVETVEHHWARTGGGKRLAQLTSIASPRPFICRQMYAPKMQHAIDALSADVQFDVVQLESSPLCIFQLPTRSKVILDEHNVEYEVFERMHESERSLPRRMFNRLESARFRKFEQRWWREVDGCLVTSEREERIVRAHAPDTPVAVVSNGVDLEYFRSPVDSAPEPHTAVFNGVLDYRPNRDAAEFLVDTIWPLIRERFAQARLTIVGRGEQADLRALARPGITLTGVVPDVRPFLRDAAVVVVPVRMGGGTRLKVIEGLSMGKAMVSTSLGCEGINVRDGEHLLVADEARAFADAVIALFEKPSLARALGRAGHERMREEYTWELAGERQEELYRRVLGRAAGEREGRAPDSGAERHSTSDA